MGAARVFDGDALINALDAERAGQGLSWNELAEELTNQSSELNAELMDQALCPGALVRTAKRGTMSCQYALTILRWINRAPEEFLVPPLTGAEPVALPEAGADHRLRWDLHQLHTSLNAQRQERGLTWAELAEELDCTPGRLTNLRTARLADMGLTMRITQWLGDSAATYIHPARW